MDLTPCSALLGSILVPDIANPRPMDVDVAFMRYRMDHIVRFSGHPAALTLSEHQRLVGVLADALQMGSDVAEWGRHHDHHEYAIGDMVRPVQRAIGAVRLDEVKSRWDVAICGALGLQLPDPWVRDQVAVVDDLAMGFEWRFLLGRDLRELGIDPDLASCCDEPGMVWSILSKERRQEIRAAQAIMAG